LDVFAFFIKALSRGHLVSTSVLIQIDRLLSFCQRASARIYCPYVPIRAIA